MPEKKAKIEVDDFLTELKFLGGPTDPLECFELADESNILYAKVKVLSDAQTSTDEDASGVNNCYDVIAKYLVHMANTLTSEAYKHFGVFAENFRRCLNIKGWEELKIPAAGDFCSENDA